jgi:hypothetical protein
MSKDALAHIRIRHSPRCRARCHRAIPRPAYLVWSRSRVNAPCHRSMSVAPARAIPPRTGPAPAGPPHPRFPTATTFSTWPIPHDLPHPEMASERAFRSTRPPSNATCARSGSPVPTTCDLTCGRILTSDHSYAPFATRHLLGSTTGSDTKACTLARRNLSAKATLRSPDSRGDVGDASRAPMLWVAISGPRPGACASSHCSTRRLRSGSASSRNE